MFDAPNNRAGVDAGLAIQFLSARPWPGTTQHGRSGTMKLLLIALLTSCFMPAFAADQEELLKSARAEVDGIWTNWMEMPKLTYDRITTNKLKSLYGQWAGSYAEADKTRVNVDFRLKVDGTWSSESWPDVDDGHWYLYEGLILLYEHPVSDEADCEFAVIMRRGKLRILSADAPRGYVELKKKPKPEPNGVANRRQPIQPGTNRALPAAGADR